MDNELRTNAKSLSQEQQYRLRVDIVRLLRQGFAASAVAKMLDVSRAHVYATKKTYDEKGIKGIKPGKRGRRHGQKRILSPEQERVIRELITEKTRTAVYS
jgi:transposase